MADWKTYKGLGPWSFAKSQADNRYNVGNKIVSTSQPVWGINHSGIPITGRHDPCGLWNREYIEPGSEELTPVVVPTNATVLDEIAWSPYVGGIHGRFVGFRFFNNVTYTFYSDDGGYNWTSYNSNLFHGTGIFSSNTRDTLTFHRDYPTNGRGVFSCSWYQNSESQGTAVSEDGIVWTQGANIAYNGGPLRYALPRIVGYNKTNKKFFMGAGSAAVAAWVSDDCLNWTKVTALGNYSGYRGAFAFKEYAYLYSHNYARFYKAGGDFTVWTALVGGEIPFWLADSVRAQMTSNGNFLLYDRSMLYTPGDNQIYSPHRFMNIDYGPERGVFASWAQNVVPSMTHYISLSLDGISWIHVYVHPTYPSDMAVGFDRVVVANFAGGNCVILLD